MSNYNELVEEAIKVEEVRPLAWRHVTKVEGLRRGSDAVIFHFDDGSTISLHHVQDCCEHVRVEDFELQGKLKGPLLGFEETIKTTRSDDGTGTWTFYNIRVGTGCLNLRWIGESNGYYSESITVSVEEAEKAQK